MPDISRQMLPFQRSRLNGGCGGVFMFGIGRRQRRTDNQADILPVEGGHGFFSRHGLQFDFVLAGFYGPLQEIIGFYRLGVRRRSRRLFYVSGLEGLIFIGALGEKGKLHTHEGEERIDQAGDQDRIKEDIAIPEGVQQLLLQNQT